MSVLIQPHTKGRVPGPGFYAMPAGLYHGDPAPEPSLSASLAVTLLNETPLHGWTQHPRLNPDFEPDLGGTTLDMGSVVHELVLGTGAGFEVFEFEDWRTKEARTARHISLDCGLTPILRHQFEVARALAYRIEAHLAALPDCADFVDPHAQSELVMVWQDVGGVWCRAMLDRITPRGTVYDIKTSARSLADRALQAKFMHGFAVQPAFYFRGLRMLWPEMEGRFRWRWVFAEQDQPQCVRVQQAGNHVFGLGDDQAETAIRIWRQCVTRDRWPGYPAEVGTLDPPELAFTRWQESQGGQSVNAPYREAAE